MPIESAFYRIQSIFLAIIVHNYDLFTSTTQFDLIYYGKLNLF